jgi:hypothetical protein
MLCLNCFVCFCLPEAMPNGNLSMRIGFCLITNTLFIISGLQKTRCSSTPCATAFRRRFAILSIRRENLCDRCCCLCLCLCARRQRDRSATVSASIDSSGCCCPISMAPTGKRLQTGIAVSLRNVMFCSQERRRHFVARYNSISYAESKSEE